MEFILRKYNHLWQNIAAYKEHLKSLSDGNYKIVITATDKRSLPQNSWFHAVLPEIMMGLREAGFYEVKTNEDAKDVVKALFFKKEVTNGSETIEVIQGTSKTSKFDFTSKAEEIIKWAAEYLNIQIAPPEKQLEVWQE